MISSSVTAARFISPGVLDVCKVLDDPFIRWFRDCLLSWQELERDGLLLSLSLLSLLEFRLRDCERVRLLLPPVRDRLSLLLD